MIDLGRLLEIGVIAIIVGIVSITIAGFLVIGPDPVEGSKCLVGDNHNDNKPLTWKGKKLIEEGASLCEVAKKCDSMEIDVKIDNKKELHQTEMYKNANSEQQKELDEYAEHGKGHDNPNLKCYEIEASVKK